MLAVRWFAGMAVAAVSACEEPGMSGPPPIAIDRECELGSVPCVEGAYCDVVKYPPDCGERGRCVAMPTSCEAESDLRCGCDGEVHENACAAAMAGVAIGNAPECTPPAGTFACGDRFCEVASEYCEYELGGGAPDLWACLPLDCAAGAGACECVTDPTPCTWESGYFSVTCDVDEDGGTRVSCLRP